MKFKGAQETLVEKIQTLGYQYEVKAAGSGLQFRTTDGAVLNWYPSTGTINFQGDAGASAKLKEKLEPLLSGDMTSTRAASPVAAPIAPAKVEAKGKVFVVHGHDQTSREQLELVLHKLGLDPFVLQNTGGAGLTIIEALEQEIGPDAAEVKFGIVLLTPDDFGYAKSDGADKAQPRARQNVVLEMGMLLSSIGRKNVAILKKGHVDVPSDAQGILYLGFNDHVKEVVPRLVDRLTNAGFVLDPSNITKASS
ncbi:nucleotide-binding protein [Burkholderia lata]|uniref:Nucleotide-binding protein n=1 Tax=Burkholderia lata (strain ATCC 17760 / DSM 23089 / LMG 22485 / NCIMB 9086 / R18194 / 383) TaxID=482957 RepID=A0A6P2MC94_BURL3|nr:TIR domain-containing protein [Burkholderia lata]VWB82651.1 nucleotide-binding protein [Burkholderia lata]